MPAKPATGRLFQIAWSNQYTAPPAGAPRVLAEVFVPIENGGQPTAEFNRFSYSLGGGYAFCITHISPPSTKSLPPETLARVRQKRLARRVAAKVPMFADHFIAQEVSRKPDYYNGVTDPELERQKVETLAQELERYEELISRPGVLVVYGQEPQECREKSARLHAEIAELQERSRQRAANTSATPASEPQP